MNFRTFALWALYFLIIALGVYLIFYIKSESYRCMNNSASYLIQNLEETNDANVTCFCTSYSNKKYGNSGMTFGLDRTGMVKPDTIPIDTKFVTPS